MDDTEIPASAQPETTSSATRAAPRRAPKPKRRKVVRHAAAPRAASSVQPASGFGAMVAVYIVLGLLVIGTSFYLGYLVGKGGAGPTPGTTGGDDETTLTVIEYSDFQCPFCSRAAPTVTRLKQEYAGRVTVEFKNFPLESIHPDALGAAIAAECVRKAKGDDAFWTYHDTLFANQGALDTASLKSYASKQGIDIASCLDNQETLAKVRADMAEAQDRGVRGTPSFWVGDELVVGAIPYEQLKATVDQKLAGGTAAPAPAPAPQPAPAPSAPVDVAAGSFTLGDADAPVLIVEFTDYQCPFCKRAHDQTYGQIKSEYIDAGKVRYSVRHYPLPFHTDAPKASEAVECAGKVGGADAFWEYHDIIFANQDSIGIASLKSYAGQLGLDQKAFDSCLDGGEFAAKVQADTAAGSAAGVSGTPTFFVNGKAVVGAQPYTVFKATIDAALQ